MAMNQLNRVGSREGQGARQQFIEGDPERVQVAARIGCPVHAAGLLRRHVGEGSRDHIRGLGQLMFASQAGRNSESGEPGLAANRIKQDVCRLDVPVNQAVFVGAAYRLNQCDRNLQESRRIKRLPDQPIQRLAARVF